MPVQTLLNYRVLALLGFLGCVTGLLFALYLEHFRGYEPCPMCVFQRVAMLAAGAVLLVAALHGPRAGGRWVYAVLAYLAALTGALIAARHVWLQSLPPELVPACGPTLDYLMEFMPMAEIVQLILSGDGNCAKIDAAWLGLSLPFWTMLAFIALALWALLLPILPRFARDPRSLA